MCEVHCACLVWLVSRTNGPALTWWRHQMETFYALLAFMRGIHRSPVNYPRKGQWRTALMFSLICAWINGWVNNRGAGDWWRHRAHYDVNVVLLSFYWNIICLLPITFIFEECFSEARINGNDKKISSYKYFGIRLLVPVLDSNQCTN